MLGIVGAIQRNHPIFGFINFDPHPLNMCIVHVEWVGATLDSDDL